MPPTIFSAFEDCRKVFADSPLAVHLLQQLEPKRYHDPQNAYWPYWAATLDAIPALRMACESPGYFRSTPECFAMLGITEGLKYNQPTYYVTKELGQALLRTLPPAHLPIERLRLPFPSFRVVLEKGTYQLANGAEFACFQFGKTGTGDFTLPPNVRATVEGANRYRVAMAPSWYIHSSGIEPTAKGNEVFYSFFNAPVAKVHLIGDLLPEAMSKQSPPYTLFDDGLSVPTLANDPTVLDMAGLLINLAMLLTSRPDYATQETIIRKGKQKGSRKVDDLWAPRIVGSKFRTQHTHTGTGATDGTAKQTPHWRAGHWKDQPYGPKHSLRRELWIEPYAVNFNTEGSNK